MKLYYSWTLEASKTSRRFSLEKAIVSFYCQNARLGKRASAAHPRIGQLLAVCKVLHPGPTMSIATQPQHHSIMTSSPILIGAVDESGTTICRYTHNAKDGSYEAIVRFHAIIRVAIPS